MQGQVQRHNLSPVQGFYFFYKFLQMDRLERFRWKIPLLQHFITARRETHSLPDKFSSPGGNRLFGRCHHGSLKRGQMQQKLSYGETYELALQCVGFSAVFVQEKKKKIQAESHV